MSLVREATTIVPGYKIGDKKIAHYDIAFTANQLVEPTQDPGWFLLNGAIISQTTYPILFNLFGSAYNTGGEGAGNFRLPDFTEGRVPITKGLANFTTRGASGGEINHTITSTEMYNHVHGNTLAWASISHGHAVSGAWGNADSHAHTMSAAVADSQFRSGSGTGTHNMYGSTGSSTTSGASANHFHSGSLVVNAATSSVSLSGSVSSAGLGGSHNNMQPYLVVGGWLVRYR
jgi:microcystin-dependent protein